MLFVKSLHGLRCFARPAVPMMHACRCRFATGCAWQAGVQGRSAIGASASLDQTLTKANASADPRVQTHTCCRIEAPPWCARAEAENPDGSPAPPRGHACPSGGWLGRSSERLPARRSPQVAVAWARRAGAPSLRIRRPFTTYGRLAWSEGLEKPVDDEPCAVVEPPLPRRLPELRGGRRTEPAAARAAESSRGRQAIRAGARRPTSIPSPAARHH
jgi:hypothetical protein